jgi:hypothetical protein
MFLSLDKSALDIAREGIHSNRINAENIRQSRKEIHHVRPPTGFCPGGGTRFSMDMVP